MATPQEVEEIVMMTLGRLVRPLVDRAVDPQGYAQMRRDYVDSLMDYRPEVLTAGMRLWRDDWQSQMWPPVGKLRVYMGEAQREIGRRNPAPRLPKPIYQRTGPFVDPMWVSRWREIFESGEIGRWSKEEAYRYCTTGERPVTETEAAE